MPLKMTRARSLARWEILLFFLALAVCPSSDTSLSRILNRGKITVITDNSAHGYYIYREASMALNMTWPRHLRTTSGLN